MLASELFATSQGSICSGEDRCHWCGSSCERLWPHDDPIVPPLFKTKSNALCPGNGYICHGCWLWRRKRVTVPFLVGGFQDGQEAGKHSWWITATGGWAIRGADCLPLYRQLLEPPLAFALLLKSADCPRSELHLAVANQHAKVMADTELFFTLDNKPLSYTVYDLDTALKVGEAGQSPGVQALFRFLGKPVMPPAKPKDKGRGMEDGRTTKKVVTAASGKIPNV